MALDVLRGPIYLRSAFHADAQRWKVEQFDAGEGGRARDSPRVPVIMLAAVKDPQRRAKVTACKARLRASTCDPAAISKARA